MALAPKKIPSYRISEIKPVKQQGKDFELYRFSYFGHNIDHLVHAHRHDHFALFFVTSGHGSHLIDFKEYELCAKRVFFIAPGQIHAWKSFKRIQGMVLLFTRDFFTLTLQYRELRSYLFDNMIYQRPYVDLDADSYRHLKKVFANMENENNGSRKYALNILRSYINIVLFEVARVYERSIPLEEGSNKAYLMVKEFTQLVNKHFKTVQTVNQYAAMLNITPGHLNFISKKFKGKNAGRIMHERIILEAQRLLVHSETPVAQIAYDLNFEDNSYFGRYFKKHTGITPAAFRASINRK